MTILCSLFCICSCWRLDWRHIYGNQRSPAALLAYKQIGQLLLPAIWPPFFPFCLWHRIPSTTLFYFTHYPPETVQYSCTSCFDRLVALFCLYTLGSLVVHSAFQCTDSNSTLSDTFEHGWCVLISTLKCFGVPVRIVFRVTLSSLYLFSATVEKKSKVSHTWDNCIVSPAVTLCRTHAGNVITRYCSSALTWRLIFCLYDLAL